MPRFVLWPIDISNNLFRARVDDHKHSAGPSSEVHDEYAISIGRCSSEDRSACNAGYFELASADRSIPLRVKAVVQIFVDKTSCPKPE